jgi:SAM-dependent methyltransferase
LVQGSEFDYWERYQKVFATRGGSKIIEGGCGTGFVSSYLEKLGYDINCADLSLQGLNYCKKRDAGNSYYQFNMYDALFYEHYDGVCAFDVIEHIDDDQLVLQNMNKALKAGGFIFVTVPANKKLWSEIDEFSKHKRRYNLVELKDKIENAGFKIMRISYFMTILFPFMWIYVSRFRFLRNTSVSKDEIEISSEKALCGLNLNPILNAIFFYIFRLETYLLNHINLPFGSSLLCVAQKKGRLI